MQVVATTRRALSRPGHSHKSLGAFIVTGAVQALLLICLLFFPRVAGADSFTYDDFASTSGLTMNGATDQNGDTIRLTPATGTAYYAGSLWASTKQSVAGGFDTRFTFDISEPDTDLQGADGIVFVIQNESVNALGAAGGSIGYASDNTTAGISNSVAIEFDTYQNQSDMKDPDGMHISVHTNGTGINSASEDYSIARTSDIPDLSDSSNHVVRITYVPGTLSVYLDDLTAPILTASLNLSTRLSLDDGKAYVGFTSALATGRENHDLVSWDFVSGDDLPSLKITEAKLTVPRVVKDGNSYKYLVQLFFKGTGEGDYSGRWTIDEQTYITENRDDVSAAETGWTSGPTIAIPWSVLKGPGTKQIQFQFDNPSEISTGVIEASITGFDPAVNGWKFVNQTGWRFGIIGICLGMSSVAVEYYPRALPNQGKQTGLTLALLNARHIAAQPWFIGIDVTRRILSESNVATNSEVVQVESDRIRDRLRQGRPRVMGLLPSRSILKTPGGAHAVVATGAFYCSNVYDPGFPELVHNVRRFEVYDPNHPLVFNHFDVQDIGGSFKGLNYNVAGHIMNYPVEYTGP